MRLHVDRPARLLSVILLLPAVVGFALIDEMSWRAIGANTALSVIGIGLLGLLARWLGRRGHVRSERWLQALVIVGALACLGHHHGLPRRWPEVLAILVGATPLVVAAIVVSRTRGTAAFAMGATILMAGGSWYVHPVPALMLFAFLLGRDALRSDQPTTLRQGLSLIGAGAFAVFLGNAVAFDVWVLTLDTFRPEVIMSWGETDRTLTFVPRVALECALLAACLAHTRGRTWGVLTIVAGIPLLSACTWADLPAVGGVCFAWGHPLEEAFGQLGLLEVAFGLTVFPWLGPLTRALRSPSDLADDAR